MSLSKYLLYSGLCLGIFFLISTLFYALFNFGFFISLGGSEVVRGLVVFLLHVGGIALGIISAIILIDEEQSK